MCFGIVKVILEVLSTCIDGPGMLVTHDNICFIIYLNMVVLLKWRICNVP